MNPDPTLNLLLNQTPLCSEMQTRISRTKHSKAPPPAKMNWPRLALSYKQAITSFSHSKGAKCTQDSMQLPPTFPVFPLAFCKPRTVNYSVSAIHTCQPAFRNCTHSVFEPTSHNTQFSQTHASCLIQILLQAKFLNIQNIQKAKYILLSRKL